SVTLSPGLSVVRDHPLLPRTFGLRPSMLHSVALPLCGATICTQVWGLTHWDYLMVPEISIACDRSNIEKLWWAEAAPETHPTRQSARTFGRTALIRSGLTLYFAFM